MAEGAPAGSLDTRPADFSSGSSLMPDWLVWRVEVGARPKRPATRGRKVDSTMICKIPRGGNRWKKRRGDRVRG